MFQAKLAENILMRRNRESVSALFLEHLNKEDIEIIIDLPQKH